MLLLSILRLLLLAEFSRDLPQSVCDAKRVLKRRVEADFMTHPPRARELSLTDGSLVSSHPGAQSGLPPCVISRPMFNKELPSRI